MMDKEMPDVVKIKLGRTLKILEAFNDWLNEIEDELKIPKDEIQETIKNFM